MFRELILYCSGYLTDDEIDRIFAEENRDMEASRGDVQVAKPLADDEMEELQSNEEEDDLMLSQSATSLGKMTGTLKENELMNSTPLGRLNNLAVYIGESTWRTLEFDTIRMEKAQMAKDPLPRPTSLTSWKSIDTLISAALDLKESILAFCQVRQVKHPECPVVTGEDLEALRTFKSAFNVFYRLMNVFSSTEARVHLVIPVFHAAITELMQLESQCQLTDRPAFTTAIDKLMESVKIFLRNNWVCAAWALNPPVRGDNLRKTFGVFSADEFSRFELDLQHREEEVVQWIKRRMEKHNEALFERMPEVKTAYQAGTLSADPQWLGNPERQWSTYNRPDHSSWQLPNESILRYWRRQAERRDLHVLASVAKDILGLATSVSGVDHLVSTFNNLTSKGNASLSVSVAAEQSCLKAWLRQGVVPPLEKAQTSLT
ncbi:hypothetical protein QFC19_005786 [Naganishia cerealis]|uniref:Uncharacterized protein n=1 Tax=Naganishia cerealis TaxID=610337 RepID=A0ACC2VNA3_9TREE|nr:hypothetical protein QFC19_005786 [Naganishia cerealis]